MVSKKNIVLAFLVGWFIPTFAFFLLVNMGYNISFFTGYSMFNDSWKECWYLYKHLDNPSEDIEIGDIVVFKRAWTGILHRVIAPCVMSGSIQGWETKGDNNDYSDGCTAYEYFNAKYVVTLWCR